MKLNQTKLASNECDLMNTQKELTQFEKLSEAGLFRGSWIDLELLPVGTNPLDLAFSFYESRQQQEHLEKIIHQDQRPQIGLDF